MRDLLVTSWDQKLSCDEAIDVNADPRKRAWVEVSPSAIEINTGIVKGLLKDNCCLMAVVKADGYGHGAEAVAKAALRGGANDLGVATLQEGIQLRQVGVDCPILVLGNLIDSEDLRACLHWKLMPTLSSERQICNCQNIAEGNKEKFIVQLKVDTGMTRLGCELEEALLLINKIIKSNSLALKGVYTHLALADGDINNRQAEYFTNLQQQRFERILKGLDKNNSNEIWFHLANSAGTLRDQKFHYDMVRVGLALYGYSPIDYPFSNLDLKPAMAVKARVTLIRQVPVGVGVSYGHRFVTKRTTRIGVIGIGYADGVSRALSGKISVLNNGVFLPQVGAITMDQLLLDLTDHPEVGVGSVVTLLGQDGEECISPQHWSNLIGSIPWEVLCGFKNRLPRVIV